MSDFPPTYASETVPPIQDARNSRYNVRFDDTRDSDHTLHSDSLSQQLTRVGTVADEAAGTPAMSKTMSRVSTRSTAKDPTPDGGYGWVVVFGVFLVNFNSWGFNSAYGIFLNEYLSKNYFPEATYLEYALIGGLSFGLALMVAPLATWVAAHWGIHVCLCIGNALQTLSLITSGNCHRIWQLFLSQGVCFGFGMGFLYCGSVNLPSRWFTKKRSLANGICSSGSGLGSMTYSLAVNAMIQSIGLPWAFRTLGICSFVANGVATLLVRDRTVGLKKPKLIDMSLFTRFEFRMLCFYGFFSMLGYVVLLFSLPTYAKDSLHLDLQQGTNVGALLNLGQGIGRPLMGYFSDHVGRVNMASAMTLLSGVLVFAIWLPARSYGVLIFYGIAGGAALGAYFATISPVTAEVMGMEDLGVAISMSFFLLVFPITFAEPIALEIYQHSPLKGLGTQIFSGLMFIGAFIFLLLLRIWLVREEEADEAAAAFAKGEKSIDEAEASTSNYFKALFSLRRV